MRHRHSMLNYSHLPPLPEKLESLTRALLLHHAQSAPSSAGQNDKGQLGVGGTADVIEPQVLQVGVCSLRGGTSDLRMDEMQG